MFEMISLFVGYFLYESDANNWWFTAYWIIVGSKVVGSMLQGYKEVKEKQAKEIEEARIYWEGKDERKGF